MKKQDTPYFIRRIMAMSIMVHSVFSITENHDVEVLELPDMLRQIAQDLEAEFEKQSD